jgi:hypothetical protein
MMVLTFDYDWSYLMTNMRDEIIDIIHGYVGSDFDGELLYANDAAEAILAALPDMIAPLVWDYDLGQFEKRLYSIFDFQSGFYVEYDGVCIGYELLNLEDAQAAANTHNRAAFKAILTGATSK